MILSFLKIDCYHYYLEGFFVEILKHKNYFGIKSSGACLCFCVLQKNPPKKISILKKE